MSFQFCELSAIKVKKVYTFSGHMILKMRGILVVEMANRKTWEQKRKNLGTGKNKQKKMKNKNKNHSSFDIWLFPSISCSSIPFPQVWSSKIK